MSRWCAGPGHHNGGTAQHPASGPWHGPAGCPRILQHSEMRTEPRGLPPLPSRPGSADDTTDRSAVPLSIWRCPHFRRAALSGRTCAATVSARVPDPPNRPALAVQRLPGADRRGGTPPTGTGHLHGLRPRSPQHDIPPGRQRERCQRSPRMTHCGSPELTHLCLSSAAQGQVSAGRPGIRDAVEP